MRKLIIALAVFMAACSSKPDIDTEKKNLLAIDSTFSVLSVDKGMTVAFLRYADRNVIEMNEGSYPCIGISALARRYNGLDNSKFVMSWKPLRCEMGAAADLAYTFGDWKMHVAQPNGTDSVIYGNYVTIWKKQADGNWKFVLDGGNGTPGPTTMK